MSYRPITPLNSPQRDRVARELVHRLGPCLLLVLAAYGIFIFGTLAQVDENGGNIFRLRGEFLTRMDAVLTVLEAEACASVRFRSDWRCFRSLATLL